MQSFTLHKLERKEPSQQNTIMSAAANLVVV